jgi:hypothetical protein
MKRFVRTISLLFGLAVTFPATTGAGGTNYEPTYPPPAVAARTETMMRNRPNMFMSVRPFA